MKVSLIFVIGIVVMTMQVNASTTSKPQFNIMNELYQIILQAVGGLASSCYDVSQDAAKSVNETGGVYEIYIPPSIGKRDVYCDMETDGGNWVVFQRRMDGSVDFYRNWVDYVNGFGDVTREFWLGLEAIHQLTSLSDNEMRIDMIDTRGRHYYAKYDLFKIGPRSDNYRLNVSGYSGNASDSFASSSDSWGVLNGQQFSTKDADHDVWGGNCAVSYRGAYWYKNCLSSNLNGVYSDTSNWSGVTWYDNDRRGSAWRWHLRFVEMKFRNKRGI